VESRQKVVNRGSCFGLQRTPMLRLIIPSHFFSAAAFVYRAPIAPA